MTRSFAWLSSAVDVAVVIIRQSKDKYGEVSAANVAVGQLSSTWKVRCPRNSVPGKKLHPANLYQLQHFFSRCVHTDSAVRKCALCWEEIQLVAFLPKTMHTLPKHDTFFKKHFCLALSTSPHSRKNNAQDSFLLFCVRARPHERTSPSSLTS